MVFQLNKTELISNSEIKFDNKVECAWGSGYGSEWSGVVNVRHN